MGIPMSATTAMGGTCAQVTPDVASQERVRRWRSFIGIVAPGCESLCHNLSGGPRGGFRFWAGAGQVPRLGQVQVR